MHFITELWMLKNTLNFSVILAWLPALLLCVLLTDYRSVYPDVTFMGLITKECWRETVLLWNTFHKTRTVYSLPLFSTSFRCQLVQGMAKTLRLQRDYDDTTHIHVVESHYQELNTFPLRDVCCNCIFISFTDSPERGYMCEFPNHVEID